MSTMIPPDNVNNIDNLFNQLNDQIHDILPSCVIKNKKVWDTFLSRWQWLISTNDSKYIWRAINWKGEISNIPMEHPTDASLKAHFAKLLFDATENTIDCDVSECPYIPVLDDVLDEQEIGKSISELNPNKAPDHRGISPGIPKLFPTDWISSLLTIFNLIFVNSVFPIRWMFSKLFAIFKKGLSTSCGNYRGICINDSIFKIFDKMLLNRLVLWYHPLLEQAGCQKNKGCIDQILTLRLLIDSLCL